MGTSTGRTGVLLVVIVGVIVGCTAGTTPTTTSTTVTSTTVAGTTTSPPTTAAPPTSTATSSLPVVPWNAAAASPDDVPAPVVASWQSADNRANCAPLAPTDPELTSGFTARSADFSGGWAVAWDADGFRSAFGVAGTGVGADASLAQRWPGVVRYADGSVLGYGGEGLDDSNPKRLGELVIPGQRCLYQVWSGFGDDHLLRIVSSLRYVDVG